MRTTKYKSIEELEDKYFGKIGTPERDDYEFDLKMELIGVFIILMKLINCYKA